MVDLLPRSRGYKMNNAQIITLHHCAGQFLSGVCADMLFSFLTTWCCALWTNSPLLFCLSETHCSANLVGLFFFSKAALRTQVWAVAIPF